MKCPIDGSTLVITERSGVEIDYCPQCRGVWLDRGELDKILELSGAAMARTAPPPPPRQAYVEESDYDDRPRKKKKRGGFGLLEDIFDF